MIIPPFHQNYDGDVVMEITHLSEDKKEQTKLVFDRKNYKNWITINPLNNKVTKYECECTDFIINKKKHKLCKHLKTSADLIKNFGITFQ